MKKTTALLLSFIMLCFLIFSPPVLANETKFIVVAGGGQNTLALDSDGNVWGWGYNQYGQIGDGTTKTRPYRVMAKGLPFITQIAAGGMSSFAIDQEGNVWTWGNNSEGQLGDGTTNNRFLPAKIEGLSGITSLSAGQSHVLAIKDDGTVLSWGTNSSGMLGYDTGGNCVPTPTVIPSLSDVSDISGGLYYSAAIKNDGTAWAWGENICGQLGDGTTTDKNIPTQVEGLTDLKKIE
ncbi:MAG: hypothetical protein GX434_12760 [Peptococcaceae bacterium]|nr:hypothetical protein [Peptococcaceae bacterium]